jgi:N-acetylmuramoyl-L-alanine amidase
MHFFFKFLCLFIVLLSTGFHQPVASRKYKIKTIILDAGHGGKDPGAVGKFSKEKEIALQVTLALGNLIQKHMKDVRVIFTREKDEFVPLYHRSKMANKNNTDLFISIHCNAAEQNKNSHGVEIFTMGLEKTNQNLTVAKRENGVILIEDDFEYTYQGFDPNSPESHILFSLYQNVYSENSLKLAQHIEEGFAKHTQRKRRGIKQGGFLVLWQTTAPSVLIEVGFITNPEEEQYLRKKHGQNQIITAIFEGIKKYKADVETK